MPLRWTNFLVVKICPKHDCKNSRLIGQLTGVPKLDHGSYRYVTLVCEVLVSVSCVSRLPPVSFYRYVTTGTERSFGSQGENGGAHDGGRVHYGSASHSQGDRSLP